MTIASCESGDFMRANGEYEQNTSESNQTQVHPDVVAYVASHMPDQDDLIDVAELFKAFGDLTRAKIICALAQSEMCVSDLSVLLEMNQSAVSHQLRILKGNKLVKSRREGKNIFYSLADGHVTSILDQGMEHVNE